MTQEYLVHYGVKGMKWGQRRAAKKAARGERKAARKELRKTNKEISKIRNDSDTYLSGANKQAMDSKLASKSAKASSRYAKAVAKTYGGDMKKAGRSAYNQNVGGVGLGLAGALTMAGGLMVSRNNAAAGLGTMAAGAALSVVGNQMVKRSNEVTEAINTRDIEQRANRL